MLSGSSVGNVRIVLKPGTKWYRGTIWGEISRPGLRLVRPESGPFLAMVGNKNKCLHKLNQRQSHLWRAISSCLIDCHAEMAAPFLQAILTPGNSDQIAVSRRLLQTL